MATNIIRPTVMGEKIIAKGIGINTIHRASLRLNLLLSKIVRKKKIITDITILLVKPAIFRLLTYVGDDRDDHNDL